MDAYAEYRTQAVVTAGPAQLVAMLYEGTLKALAVAEQAMTTEPDKELANRELVRAQDILNELMYSLDHEQGGEIATNLASLYDFCIDRLVRANVGKDVGLLPAVRETVSSLAGAWDAMLRQPVPAGAGA